MCFSEQSSASTMLSRIGTTYSSEINGAGSRSGDSCKPTRLRSICSITVEPRRGSSPLPVMPTQPANLSFRRRVAASMQTSTSWMLSSVSFDARLFSISAKSSNSHESPPSKEDLVALALLVAGGFASAWTGAENAKANNTRDGAAR